MPNYIYQSKTGRGSDNLALDEYLLDTVRPGDLILYFYVNENAVIIGKNQNPWRECDLGAMERDGVELVRRVSGGGAVYHDGGNLNYSFIAGPGRYDKEKIQSMIRDAVASFGIACELSGRNDILCDGRKFSGNAFARRHGADQHHGTLLIDADLDKIRNYLTVDPKKIRSKGISSVRSRVCNLTEFRPDLTLDAMRDALTSAFGETFGPWEMLPSSYLDEQAIAPYRARHASWAWRLGETPKFDLAWDERFPWGGVELLLSLEKSVICEAHAFSDAMDADLAPALERLVTGLPLQREAIRSAALETKSDQAREALLAFSETV